MFNPEQLQLLPAFTWQQRGTNPAVQQYTRFYGMDLSQEFPGLLHCFGSRKAKGGMLVMQAFLLEKNRANVFLLHGYMDHIGLYGHLIRVLLMAGYNVVAIDLPGHGLTQLGERAGIDDFQDYQTVIKPLIAEAVTELSGTWHLVGQSTGGAIAMDYILNNPDHPFDKLVLLAPLVIPVRWPLVKFKLFTLRRFLRKVPRRFTRNSSDKAFLHFIKKHDPLQSRWVKTSWVQALYNWQPHFHNSPQSDTETLVIQGEKDIVVDWRYNLSAISSKFTRLHKICLPDANHHLVNEPCNIRDQVFTHLISFLQPEAKMTP